MRVVLYDQEDMEPITVIDVCADFIRDIEEGRRAPRLQFAAQPRLTFTSAFDDSPITQKLPVFAVDFAPIMRGKERIMWLCTTADAETALMARAAFLPGQVGEVNRQKQAAFMEGIVAGMTY